MTREIRTVGVPRCILCKAPGQRLYSGLTDRVFSVPGKWSIARCPAPECALLWLDPMPISEDVHRVYESYYTYVVDRRRRGRLFGSLLAATKRGYAANHFGYRTSASRLDRLFGLLAWLYPGLPAQIGFSIMWLEAPPAYATVNACRGARGANGGCLGRVLDVGAGSGWLVTQLNSLGWCAEGLDFDPRAVEVGRAKGLTFHSGGLLEQRFAEASFDAVTMSHSIEHVHDPVAWLAEARRILRPGGRLAIATPNTRSFLHRRFREHWFPLELPRHLHLFNRAALEVALRQSGFERFRLFTSTRDAANVFLASRSIRKRGRYEMMGHRSAPNRSLGRAVQLAELSQLVADAEAGEDLVALAER